MVRRGCHILRWALLSAEHLMVWLQLRGSQGLTRVKLPQLWAKPFIYLVPLDFRERRHYATRVQDIPLSVESGPRDTRARRRQVYEINGRGGELSAFQST